MSWFQKLQQNLPLSESEDAQRHVFEASFSMLAKLAKADGGVSKEELSVLSFFSKKVLELDKKTQEYACDVFNNAYNDSTDFLEHARAYRELLQHRPEMLEWMLDILLQIATSDRDFTAEEEKYIVSAAKIFGVSKERYKQLRARHMKKSLDDFLHILECEPGDSADKIQDCYQRLSAKYDPERISSLDLPTEFHQLAKQRFETIRHAFEEVKRGLNIS